MKEIHNPVRISVEYVLKKRGCDYSCLFVFDFQEDAWIVKVSKVDSDLEPKTRYHRSIFFPMITDASKFIESFLTRKPIVDSLGKKVNDR